MKLCSPGDLRLCSLGELIMCSPGGPGLCSIGTFHRSSILPVNVTVEHWLLRTIHPKLRAIRLLRHQRQTALSSMLSFTTLVSYSYLHFLASPAVLSTSASWGYVPTWGYFRLMPGSLVWGCSLLSGQQHNSVLSKDFFLFNFPSVRQGLM